MSSLPEHWFAFRQYEDSLLSSGNAPVTYNEWCKMNGLPFVRGVTALDERGHSIITLMAYDDLDALEKIGEQLRRNPSRMPYYNSWERGGFAIRWNE